MNRITKTCSRILFPSFVLMLAASSVQQVSAGTDSIVLCSSTGEEYFLEVDPNQSFYSVMDLIGHSLAAVDVESAPIDEIPSTKPFTMRVKQGAISVSPLSKKLAGDQPRNYNAPLTPDEAADIGYIIKTLANESLLKLKGKESSLKKVGDRVDHVHPFQFLYCVFSNEELKVGIRNIQGRSWVGKSFMEGLTSSLKKENSFGNLLPYAQDFANRLNIDVNTILPTLQNGQWEKFVDTLIKIIPRQGDSGRYDM